MGKERSTGRVRHRLIMAILAVVVLSTVKSYAQSSLTLAECNAAGAPGYAMIGMFMSSVLVESGGLRGSMMGVDASQFAGPPTQCMLKNGSVAPLTLTPEERAERDERTAHAKAAAESRRVSCEHDGTAAGCAELEEARNVQKALKEAGQLPILCAADPAEPRCLDLCWLEPKNAKCRSAEPPAAKAPVAAKRRK